MKKPKLSVPILIIVVFLRSFRVLLVVGNLILLAIPLIIVWGFVRKWNSVNKRELFNIVQDSFKPSDTYLYLAAVIVIIGIGFFVFKKNQQFWYGLLETIVALAGCLVTAQTIRNGVYHFNSANTILLQGFGAVYLLVRGLSNMDDGFKKSFWLKEDYNKFKYAYGFYAQKEKEYLLAHKEGKLFNKDGKLIRNRDLSNQGQE